MATQKKVNLESFNTKILPTWCPGCGSFGILKGIKDALIKQSLSPDDVLFVYDIGCSGNMADFLKTYAIHALHGRAIPVAVGSYFAHHTFPIIALGGDGGIYGEGVEHLIKVCRANFNITALVLNNGLYSLTTGQMSPTSEKGKLTKTSPKGVIEIPFEPLKTAIIHNAGFVARGFALDIEYLTKLIVEGMKHKGFSLIDILQPCPTFNKERSALWYKEKIYHLPDFNGLTANEAFLKLDEGDKKLVTGVLYRSKRLPYDKELSQLKDKTLLEQSIDKINIQDLIESFC